MCPANEHYCMIITILVNQTSTTSPNGSVSNVSTITEGMYITVIKCIPYMLLLRFLVGNANVHSGASNTSKESSVLDTSGINLYINNNYAFILVVHLINTYYACAYR